MDVKSAPLVTFVQCYICTKLDVSMGFCCEKIRRTVRMDREGATRLNTAPREDHMIDHLA